MKTSYDLARDYTVRYNNISVQGKHVAGSDSLPMTTELLVSAGYKSGMTVIDYGCGWGALIPLLDTNTSYLGMDISPEMIDTARESFNGHNFIVSSVGEVPYYGVDFVIAHSVFTHVPKKIVNLALKDIKNCIGKQGVALIDIYYDHLDADMYENYTNDEWLELLLQSDLAGEYLCSHDRGEFATHHYYRVRGVK